FSCLPTTPPPSSTPFPYTTLFRSVLFGQGLTIANRSILDPAVRVVHQPGQVATGTFSLIDAHLQSVKSQLGMQRSRDLPADDLAVEHVGDERDVDPPCERVHIRGGAPPACGGISATHSRSGAKAAKCRSTRSAGQFSRGADLVVFGAFARLIPCRSRSFIRRSIVHRATCPRPCESGSRLSTICIFLAPN